MIKRVEIVLVFLFLSLFSIATIYPVFNIVGVSLRTDNAFQSRSLSLFESGEKYITVSLLNVDWLTSIPDAVKN